jgi:hypothetical protein
MDSSSDCGKLSMKRLDAPLSEAQRHKPQDADLARLSRASLILEKTKRGLSGGFEFNEAAACGDDLVDEEAIVDE